jgi:hypothetical protein
MKSKKAKVDEVGPKIKELAEVLSNPECDVPEPKGNRDMLVGALPHALGDYCDVRHSYQSTMAKIVGEVLKGWVKKWEGKVAEAQAVVDTTASDREAASVSEGAAKTSLAAQKEDVKACRDALKAASDAEHEAKTGLASAKAEVSVFDENLQKIIADKDNISRVYNQSFLVMKSSEELSASEGKTHLKQIAPVMKKISTESSLQIALAPAMQKKPSERGQFDSMAIDGVEAVFKGKIQTLEGEISSADAAKAEKVAAEAAAKAAHEATEAKKQECAAALKASKEAQAEKEKSLEAAEKNLHAASQTANKALKTHSHEQSGLNHAKSNLETFQFLLERATPPPPPPSPVEEAAVEGAVAAA